jgi:hypothetical protein
MRRRSPGALLGALLAAFAVLLPACGSPGVVPTWERATALEQRTPAAMDGALSAARAALELGRPGEVGGLLAPIIDAEPGCILALVLLQEATIANLAHTQSSPTARATVDPEALNELASLARQRAMDSGLGVDLLLAARLEPDYVAAMLLLDQLLEGAEGGDPALLAWGHYAKAFLAVRAVELKRADKSLKAALAAMPGHLPARLLEARLAPRDEDRSDSEVLMAYWLERAASAPQISSQVWYDTAVDVAILRVLRTDAEGALEALGALDYVRGLGAEPTESTESPSDEPIFGARAANAPAPEAWAAPPVSTQIRAGLVHAASLASMNQAEQALAKTDATIELARSAGIDLPRGEMQRALLFELWLDDPARAAAAWERSLGIIETQVQSEASGDEFNDLLRTIQAQVRLERLARGGFLDRSPGDSP